MTDNLFLDVNECGKQQEQMKILKLMHLIRVHRIIYCLDNVIVIGADTRDDY